LCVLVVILSVITKFPPQVVRKQLSGPKENSKTVTLTVCCYSACSIKLIFLIDRQDRARSKSPEPITTDDPFKDRHFGQRLRSMGNSPGLGRRLMQSMSEHVKAKGSNNSDLTRSQSAVRTTVYCVLIHTHA